MSIVHRVTDKFNDLQIYVPKLKCQHVGEDQIFKNLKPAKI